MRNPETIGHEKWQKQDSPAHLHWAKILHLKFRGPVISADQFLPLGMCLLSSTDKDASFLREGPSVKVPPEHDTSSKFILDMLTGTDKLVFRDEAGQP